MSNDLCIESYGSLFTASTFVMENNIQFENHENL